MFDIGVVDSTHGLDEVGQGLTLVAEPASLTPDPVKRNGTRQRQPAGKTEAQRLAGPVAAELEEGLPIRFGGGIEGRPGQQPLDAIGVSPFGASPPAGDLAGMVAVPADQFFAASTTASMRAPR